MNGGVAAHSTTHAAASATAAGGRAIRHLRSRAAFDARGEGVIPTEAGSVASTPGQAAFRTQRRQRDARRLTDFMDSPDVGPIYLILVLMAIGALCTWYGITQRRNHQHQRQHSTTTKTTNIVNAIAAAGSATAISSSKRCDRRVAARPIAGTLPRPFLAACITNIHSTTPPLPSVTATRNRTSMKASRRRRRRGRMPVRWVLLKMVTVCK
jgi:hypothetical protein